MQPTAKQVRRASQHPKQATGVTAQQTPLISAVFTSRVGFAVVSRRHSQDLKGQVGITLLKQKHTDATYSGKTRVQAVGCHRLLPRQAPT